MKFFAPLLLAIFLLATPAEAGCFLFFCSHHHHQHIRHHRLHHRLHHRVQHDKPDHTVVIIKKEVVPVPVPASPSPKAVEKPLPPLKGP